MVFMRVRVVLSTLTIEQGKEIFKKMQFQGFTSGIDLYLYYRRC